MDMKVRKAAPVNKENKCQDKKDDGDLTKETNVSDSINKNKARMFIVKQSNIAMFPFL